MKLIVVIASIFAVCILILAPLTSATKSQEAIKEETLQITSHLRDPPDFKNMTLLQLLLTDIILGAIVSVELGFVIKLFTRNDLLTSIQMASKLIVAFIILHCGSAFLIATLLNLQNN